VVAAGMNPLDHYILFGNDEKRSPFPFFDVAFYLEDNPSVKRNQLNAPIHFIRYGADEGVRPNRLFDPRYYQNTYSLENLSPLDLFIHYATVGYTEKKRPSRLFDPVFYETRYPRSNINQPYTLLAYQEEGIFRGHYPCEEIASLKNKPVISIITPVYETDDLLLKRCIHSVLYQAYPHWELCLIDDGSQKKSVREILNHYGALDKRIKVHFLDRNHGIAEATNNAVAMASGEYIGFLDHDDELTVDALYEVVKGINEHNADVLYCDEDLVNLEGRHLDSFYKPDFNEELLLSHNYITHFLVTRRSLFDKTGGFSPECSGAQDYDMALKLTELAETIYHIPRILYHWRAHENSTSINHSQKDYADEAGFKALENALQRRNKEAKVEHSNWKYYYHVRPLLSGTPLVSVIVVFPDNGFSLLDWYKRMQTCFQYQSLEIICVCAENGGNNFKADDFLYEGPEIKIVSFSEKWNGAAMLNKAVAAAKGEHLLFLSCNIIPKQQEWITLLLEHSQDERKGVIGGRIEYPEFSGRKISAIPTLIEKSWQYYGDFFMQCSRHSNSIVCMQNVLAVSTELCMVSRALFNSANGFDEKNFTSTLYDADFCLRVRQSGVENVYTPLCEALYQSYVSISFDDFVCQKEVSVFKKKWQQLLLTGDPYYNIGRLFEVQEVTLDQWQNWFAREA
jgi:glycosyltransferase involved in cell wall biosynthesis